mgnify:CR=1 FL=1
MSDGSLKTVQDLLKDGVGGGSGGTAVFNTPGVTSWLVPAGVTQVTVEMWGGGGNGAPGASNRGGGGGGGGGYVKAIVNLPFGTSSLSVQVGSASLDSILGSNLVVARHGGSGSGLSGGAGGTVSLGTGATSIFQFPGVAGSVGTSAFGTGCGDAGFYTQPGNGGDGGASYTPSTGGKGFVHPTCSVGPDIQVTDGTLGGGGGGAGQASSVFGNGGTGKIIITYFGGGSGGGTSAVTFAGYTSQIYNGDLGGVVGANNKCNSEFAGSHICTAIDIERLALTNQIPSKPNYFEAFVFDIHSDNCVGFTMGNTNANYGETLYYQANGNYILKLAGICGARYPITCCK